MSKRRLTSEADEARCCYHELIDNPSENDEAGFDLRQTQAIFYVVSDVPVRREGTALPKATQATAGSLIPPEHWNTTFMKILWLMKWIPKRGLQPLRPQVTWTGPETAIRASKALRLTQ